MHAARQMQNDPLLSVRDLKAYFSAGRRRRQGRRRRELRRLSRPGRGHRRRERLRQERDHASHPAASSSRPAASCAARSCSRAGDASTGRRRRPRTSWTPAAAEMRAIRGAEIALIPQEPMASFSPVHTIGRPDHRGHPAAPAGERAAGRGRSPWRLLPRRRHLHAGAADRRLLLAAHRRPAAARHDRHGAFLRAPPADRRRADHRHRRDHPGADPRPAARPAAANRTWPSSSSPTTWA